MSRADAASSIAVRGMVFGAIFLWLCASVFDWDSMRDLAAVFGAMGAVAYLVLPRRKPDDEL